MTNIMNNMLMCITAFETEVGVMITNFQLGWDYWIGEH